MSRTPEPWKAERLPAIKVGALFGADGTPIGSTYELADAQRAALCVNALAGVSDDDLVQLPDGHLARVMPITKGWREPEFESIGEMPDLAAILARRKGDA